MNFRFHARQGATMQTEAAGRSVAELRQQIAQATGYADWRIGAVELDALEARDLWKGDPVSSYYEYNLIQQRLANLKQWRKEGDWSQLIFSLREGLHRNLGNLTSAELYKHTHVGTKYLIDDYITEVTDLLNHLCDNEIAELPYNEKLMFFRHTGQSFGRSSLMLSGGANMGWFHVGVAKALAEHDLLPRVISGSSAGSVVAALLGTRNANEIGQLFRAENLDLYFAQWLSPREMLRQRRGMDGQNLERFLRKNIGEYTFEEAFRKTKRIINVSVSPVGSNQTPRLLNYLTTPNLLVWSAVKASCALPGIFPPSMLMSKDRLGQHRPYMESLRWVDGAVASDLPAQRLSELYNVNHHIVSQVNPHVIPFIPNQRRKDSWGRFLTGLLKGELQFRSKQILRVAAYGLNGGLLKTLLDGAYAVVDQKYYGDVTIHPEIRFKDYRRVLGHLSVEEFKERVLDGERATWPKIAMIRDHTTIGHTLEQCIVRLKLQARRRSREATANAINTAAASAAAASQTATEQAPADATV